MTEVPLMTMNDGRALPQVGLGVYLVPAEDAAGVVGEGLQLGYRAIDTAWGYFNEQGVGEAIRGSGLDRDEVFVTTKVWNSYQGRDKALESFETSMGNLGLERLDLLLIHWPAPAQDLYVETWRTFVELRDSGRVGSIGVSNFGPAHLRRLVDEVGVVPAVNQVELHPYLPQRELRAVHDELGIVTEAWAPIAQGRVADDPVLQEIGRAHGKTATQVALRWELQLGVVVIPKSVRRERMAANLDLFDFELSAEEMAAVDALDRGPEGRTGPDPDRFG